MTRSIHPDRYPREFIEIVEGCAIREESWRVPYDTPRDAVRARGKFYAWMGAMTRLRREAAGRTPTPAEAEWLDILKLAERVVVWIHGSELEFMNRSQSPEAKAIRNAKITRKGEAQPAAGAGPSPELLAALAAIKELK